MIHKGEVLTLKRTGVLLRKEETAELPLPPLSPLHRTGEDPQGGSSHQPSTPTGTLTVDLRARNRQQPPGPCPVVCPPPPPGFSQGPPTDAPVRWPAQSPPKGEALN